VGIASGRHRRAFLAVDSDGPLTPRRRCWHPVVTFMILSERFIAPSRRRLARDAAWVLLGFYDQQDAWRH
jgi:hypothetical protein